MKIILICIGLFLMSIAAPTTAQDRATLGWGHLLTNDVMGDTKDRWRTGSYALSYVRGPAWQGALPGQFGALFEYRFRGEVIAPERLSAASVRDRRYVGALSIGAHTHWLRNQTELSLGLDLIFVGPQTNLDGFQAELHDIFGGLRPNVTNFQVGNAIYPTVTFEAARTYQIGAKANARPFVELQAGAETLARFGADLTFGGLGDDGLLLRDNTSGQRYVAITSRKPEGLSFFVGGDIAYVADSRYLATPGIVAEDVRGRLRAGYHRGWKRGDFFYGLTYLSKEFEAQSEGQLLGSVSVRFWF